MRLPQIRASEVFTILLVLGIFGTFADYEYSGYRGARDGRRDATKDIAHGLRKLKIGGKPQPWSLETARLFRQRHAIDVEHIYACCPTNYQSHYAQAYNDVMLHRIEKDLGSFSMDDVFRDARESWVAARSE